MPKSEHLDRKRIGCADELAWVFPFYGQGLRILTAECPFVTKCNGPVDPNSALRQSIEMRREGLSGHNVCACL